MAMSKRVGRFVIEITNPHPCWVKISYDDSYESSLSGIHIEDLRDLNYAISRAIEVIQDSEKCR